LKTEERHKKNQNISFRLKVFPKRDAGTHLNFALQNLGGQKQKSLVSLVGDEQKADPFERSGA